MVEPLLIMPVSELHNLSNYGLSGTAMFVYVTLRSFMNSETRECFPSIERIGMIAGLKRRQVKNVLRQLETVGLIVSVTNRGHGMPNLYKIIGAIDCPLDDKKGVIDCPLDDKKGVILYQTKGQSNTSKEAFHYQQRGKILPPNIRREQLITEQIEQREGDSLTFGEFFKTCLFPELVKAAWNKHSTRLKHVNTLIETVMELKQIGSESRLEESLKRYAGKDKPYSIETLRRIFLDDLKDWRDCAGQAVTLGFDYGLGIDDPLDKKWRDEFINLKGVELYRQWFYGCSMEKSGKTFCIHSIGKSGIDAVNLSDIRLIFRAVYEVEPVIKIQDVSSKAKKNLKCA